MTIEELLAREAIRDTLASYNVAGDRLRLDEFVAVFTSDAVLESDTFRCDGRQAIRDWFGGWGRAPQSGSEPVQRKPTFARHHLSTCKIDLTDAESAKARTYWMVYSDNGPDHCGYYVDDFRKEGERWLIAHRRIRVDWKSAESLFGDPTVRGDR